jgi:hypothetical protein
VASMAFTALACAYHHNNEQDKCQNVVVLTAAFAGLGLASYLDRGMLVGIFGVEVWVILLALVVSDLLHEMNRRYNGMPGKDREGSFIEV